jgi:hypothetical protein
MPDRPFPFRRRGSKLQRMSDTDQRKLAAPVIVLLACLLALAALTVLFAAVPELAGDGGGNLLSWLAA